MRNKTLGLEKIDQLDNLLIQLEVTVKTQQPVEKYLELLERSKDKIDELRTFMSTQLEEGQWN